MQVDYRELTSDEKRRLKSKDRLVSSCGELLGHCIGLVGAAGFGYLAGLLPSILLAQIIDMSHTVMLTVLPFIGAAWSLTWWIRKLVSPVGKTRRDLEDGRAMRLRIEPERVIFIAPFDDEGDGYLIELGDSRVLFLRSRYFDDVGVRFPCERVTVTRAVASGTLLDIECSGEWIEPESTIELRTFPKLRQLWESKILEGSLDDLSELRQSRRNLRSTG